MIKITRQEAKKQGLPTCYGSLCTKHPELNGLRRVSGACVECAKLSLKKRRKENPEISDSHSHSSDGALDCDFDP